MFIEKPFSLFVGTHIRITTGGKIAHARTSWRERRVECYPLHTAEYAMDFLASD